MESAPAMKLENRIPEAWHACFPVAGQALKSLFLNVRIQSRPALLQGESPTGKVRNIPLKGNSRQACEVGPKEPVFGKL